MPTRYLDSTIMRIAYLLKKLMSMSCICKYPILHFNSYSFNFLKMYFASRAPIVIADIDCITAQSRDGLLVFLGGGGDSLCPCNWPVQR